MTKIKSPASGKRQGLEINLSELNTSIMPKGLHRLTILNQIANKWVDRRCYSTVDRALRALIGGDL